MSQVLSLREAGTRLSAMVRAMHAGERAAMQRACRLVRREARDALGQPHQGDGPFAAWPPLAPATEAQRLHEGYAPDAALLRSGALRDSIGFALTAAGDGRQEGVVGSTSEIAVYQELGTSRVPPRSFLGAAGVRLAPAVAIALARGVVGALSGRPGSGGQGIASDGEGG